LLLKSGLVSGIVLTRRRAHDADSGAEHGYGAKEEECFLV
jgi:hypothetical protein